MIKKMLYFSTILIFYFLINQSIIKAKEYCHLYVSDELYDTVELPFYFYELERVPATSGGMPSINYNKKTTYIDSLTKCELINKKIIYSIYIATEQSDVAHYSNVDDNISNKELFDTAIFKKNETTVKGLATKKDEEAPIISGYKEQYTTNIDYPLKLEFLLSNFSSYDNFDGNISKNLKIEYEEYTKNIDKVGNYIVIISSQDSNGNKTSATFYIEVVDTTSPIINGKTNYISYISSPLKIEEIKNNLSGIDNTNYDLTSQIFVCEDLYSTNKNQVGKYNIYFCVYDKSNNLSNPYKVTVEVKDDIPPIIEGLNFFDSFLSNPLTTKEILYSLAASDNGYDISESIFIIKDDYSNHLNIIGEKSIYFQAMDQYNNLSLPFKVTINLIDDISPQIFGLNIFDSYLSSPLSLTYIKQQLTVIDNIDGNITSSIQISNDSYSSNINNKGIFFITFTAKDKSSNKSEDFKMTINNIDDIPPSFIGPLSLNYKLDYKPNLETILSQYKAVDNIDSNISFTVIEENYSTSIGAGTFYIKLSCTDSSDNTSIPFIININISEEILEPIKILLFISTSSPLSIEEINKLLNLKDEYKIIKDTYSSNNSQIGTYTIEYEIKENKKIITNITTFNQQAQEKLTNNTIKKEPFFNKIKRFFKNIYYKIKTFIKNIIPLLIFPKYL